jgi:hypothetical protein
MSSNLLIVLSETNKIYYYNADTIGKQRINKIPKNNLFDY